MYHTRTFRTFSIILLIGLLAAGCASPRSEGTPLPTAAAADASTAAPAPPTPTVELPVTGPTAAPDASPTSLAPSGSQELWVIVPEQSEARYRVTEQLVNVSLPNDAVGRTKQISGSISIGPDGTVDPAASRIVVDLSTLESDRSQRDNFLRRNVLQTDQYPEAVFVPTRISGVTFPIPESGELNYQLTGDLTIRDVTREVTWDVTGSVQSGQATGQAVTSFNFAEFNLTQPSVPVVLSIEDNIILELDLVLTRTS